jgi:hypothetical protein
MKTPLKSLAEELVDELDNLYTAMVAFRKALDNLGKAQDNYNLYTAMDNLCKASNNLHTATIDLHKAHMNWKETIPKTPLSL